MISCKGERELIIEIESVYGDMLLHGNFMEETELRAKVNELLTLVREKEFVSAFCMRFGYEILSVDSDVKADYRIDLDTHWIYKPK